MITNEDKQNFPSAKGIVSPNNILKIKRYIPRVKNKGVPEHFFITGMEGTTSFIKHVSQELEDNFQMIPIYIDARGVKTVDELIGKYTVKTELGDFLINTCKELNKGYGLFIVIDDVNSLSESEEFTHWYKGLFETLTLKEYYLPVVFTLISSPEAFEKLCLINESFTRMFHLIEL